MVYDRRFKTPLALPSGKKTVIATILFLLSTFIQQVVIDIWHFQPLWIDKANLTLIWLASVLGGLGLTHKAVKKANA